VRVPSEADERVRDVVRWRETFQGEILKSWHYHLKFLAAPDSSIATAHHGARRICGDCFRSFVGLLVLWLVLDALT
jgi:hypothetical protein